jgi:N-acetylneuraminic acid mutarotase
MGRGAAVLFVIVFLTAFCLVIADPVLSSDDTKDDYWATKTPIPEAHRTGLAVVDGKIYAIEAEASYMYDPTTDNWTTRESMPTARTYFGIASYQGKIYCIGGSGSNGSTGVNEVYDTQTDTWETKKSMPTARSDLSANVVNGKIYLIGGRTGDQFSTVDSNEVYNVANDSWTTKKQIPYPVVGYASAVVDDKVYIIGGQDEFHHNELNVKFNQIYDPETDEWRLGASLPTTVFNAAAGATTGTMAPKRIYIIGGTPNGEIAATNLNQVYNPENDTWTYGTSMPTSRGWLAVAVVNDTLYAIGGSPGLMISFIPINEHYIPIGYGTIPQDTETPFPPISIVLIVSVTIFVAAVSIFDYFRKRKH